MAQEYRNVMLYKQTFELVKAYAALEKRPLVAVVDDMALTYSMLRSAEIEKVGA